jgi:hypothetical protein
MKRAGRLRGQGPYLDHPDCRTALTRRRPELNRWEGSVTEAFWRTRQEKRIGIPNGQISPSEWQETRGPLLRHVVALLAMKHGRAPLPVSSALWKGLLRQGFLNDLDELGIIARRFSFLEDERLVLAELRVRTATTPPVRETLSKENEFAAEDSPQIKDAHICQ